MFSERIGSTNWIYPIDEYDQDTVLIYEYFQIITSIERDKVHGLVKQYTPKLKQLLVFDRVSEAIQIFCANNTIDEVNMNIYILNDMKNV